MSLARWRSSDCFLRSGKAALSDVHVIGSWIQDFLNGKAIVYASRRKETLRFGPLRSMNSLARDRVRGIASGAYSFSTYQNAERRCETRSATHSMPSGLRDYR